MKYFLLLKSLLKKFENFLQLIHWKTNSNLFQKIREKICRKKNEFHRGGKCTFFSSKIGHDLFMGFEVLMILVRTNFFLFLLPHNFAHSNQPACLFIDWDIFSWVLFPADGDETRDITAMFCPWSSKYVRSTQNLMRVTEFSTATPADVLNQRRNYQQRSSLEEPDLLQHGYKKQISKVPIIIYFDKSSHQQTKSIYT